MFGFKSIHAARLTDIGTLTIEYAPIPAPVPDDALIKIAHCALCSTVAKMLTMGHRDLELPRILGHEVYGRLEETGEPVVVWPGVACGDGRAMVRLEALREMQGYSE